MKFDLTHYGPGRPPLPETLALMQRMLREIEREPGIMSAKLARRLDIPSLECATLANRLKKRGFITVGRSGRARTYTLNDEAA